MRKVIERLSGAGKVYREDGELLGEASYDLQVYQEYRDASSMGNPGVVIPGLKDIEGRVIGLDNFALTGAELTLHLEDGRRLRFYVTDQDGRIGSSGGLQEPS